MPAFRSLCFSLFAVLAVPMVLLFAAHSVAQQEQSYSPVAAARATVKAKVGANYGRIPLSFEANRGQTDRSVQFLSRGQGYTLFLRPGEALLALRSGNRTAAKKEAPAGTSLPNQPGRLMPKSNENQISLVRMSLVGANAYAAAHEEDEQITKTNYFIGNDPAKWRTDIANYGRVRYAGIYPGIDLVYYGNQSRLEHDFVVAPGADPAHIRLSFNGAKRTRIDPATGDIILRTREGEIRLLKPVSYQESDGHRAAVSSSYKLFSDNRIGFHVASYNHTQPLVIDPILVYSTYLGGSGLASTGRYSSAEGDQGNGIAVDSNGDAYIVGTTYSSNFPVTNGALQPQNYALQTDNSSTVFVSELNPSGTALVSSTYLGGTNSDAGYGIALDSSSNIYVTGVTHSVDFPITCGAFQSVSPAQSTSNPSGFVVKLGPSGSALIYATFLGADGGDVPQTIAVDSAGDAFIAGYTGSTGFPTTEGALQTSLAGTVANGFVSKLNPSGSALAYSTYLGGGGTEKAGDYINAIAIDSQGDAYVTGSTASSDFPVTKSALQSSALGSPTAFVTEINPAGSDEVYSSYLGGSSGDSAQAIAIDSGGSIYVAGNTNSGDFPLTEGVLEGASTGIAKYVAAYGQFGFITKLNPSTPAMVYSTYVEGQGTSISALAVDGAGNAYLTGTAPVPSANIMGGFETTPDALPAPANQGNAPFLVKLNPSAGALQYATFIGGSSIDNPLALAIDGSGSAYLTGLATSSNFPTTAQALQATNNATAAGTSNAFVAKLAVGPEANETSYPNVLDSITTSISNVWAEFTGNYTDGFELLLSFDLDAGASGPPFTGSFTIDCGQCQFQYQCPQCGNGFFGPVGVSGLWGNSSPLGAATEWIYYGPTDFQIIYSGDSVHQPVTLSVSNYTVQCSSNNGSCYENSPNPRSPSTKARAPVSIRIKAATIQPKFVPAPANSNAESAARLKRPLAYSQSNSACLVTHAITAFMKNAARDYGAPNPPFGYQLTGVPSGYTIDVNSFSPATPSSPVGSYPITATATAPPYDSFHVYNATLQVNKAKLTVAPNDAYQLAGVPRKAFSYVLLGLANGDTASVAHGEPVLTTAAPAVPTPGAYPILATPGTLTAQNYSFVRGRGELNVFRPIGIVSDSSAGFSVIQGPAGIACGGVASQAGQIQGVFQFAQSALPQPGAKYTGRITFSAPNPGLYLGAMQLYGNCTPVNLPSSIDINPPAKLLVSFPIYGDVLGPLSVFEPVTQAVVQPRGAAKLESPQAVAIDGNGALYIADSAKNQIVKVSGASKTTLSLAGVKLNAPSALAVDGTGDLDIADTGNDRIVQFTPSGQAHVVPLGTRTLARPRGLVVDRIGGLLIADTGHNRIVVVEANGVVSQFATGKLKLSHPSGLAVDAAGDLFIADTGNNRIVKVTSIGAASVVAVGKPSLNSPVGIALDAAGSLYITEKNSKELIEVSPAGIQSELPPGGLSDPAGIIMDPSGTLYIADTGNRRVFELGRDSAPHLRFEATREGQVSAGGPQQIKIRNIGNVPLGIYHFIFPPDFSEDPSAATTDCKSGETATAIGETLAPSASCTLSIEFKPVAAVAKGTNQLLKEWIIAVSNTIGYSNTDQYIYVEGTEIK